MKFNEIKEINEHIVSYLNSNKITDMTAVQAQSFKHIYNNKDMIICSNTATGKTLAYLLPIIARLDAKSNNIQALILAPTGELASQIAKVANELLEYDEKLNAQFVVGEANIKRQIEHLKKMKPAILVATPARALELISSKKIKVHEVKTFVLDESDRLLNKTFETTIKNIRKSLMKRTQVLLLSASINKKTKNEAKELCFNPIYLDINANTANESQVPKTIKHFYFFSDRRERIENLRKIIKAAKPEKCIIFINTKYDLDESYQKLQYHNYNVACLSSNQDSLQKKNTIEGFKTGKYNILIATDIAARGLQIDNIDTVINVNLPEENEEYIHRAGRCGRNGNKGTCISIITENEISKIKKYQKAFNINFIAKKLYQGKIVAK